MGNEILKTVHDESGRCLGDMFVDLSPLGFDTKKAIIHIIYLDKLLAEELTAQARTIKT